VGKLAEAYQKLGELRSQGSIDLLSIWFQTWWVGQCSTCDSKISVLHSKLFIKVDWNIKNTSR
jgi:hypothetical protein